MVPGLGGTVSVTAAALSGREGGKVAFAVGVEAGGTAVVTWAPQAVRAATAVRPMNATVLGRIGTTFLLNERGRGSTGLHQAVDRRQVARGLVDTVGEVA